MTTRKFNNIEHQRRQLDSDPRVGMKFLDVYIPRIDGRYTEEDIRYTFKTLQIGLVDYVDFLATKNPDTKEILFYSAFVKLLEWNADSRVYNDMVRYQKFKLFIEGPEFWMLMPAKTPLSRSKVNTHQLSAYTDELFVRVEAIETESAKKSREQTELINKQAEIIKKQSDQISQLFHIVSQQTLRLVNMENFLEKQYPKVIETDDIKCVKCDMKFDEEKQLEFHNMVCDLPTELPKLTLKDLERDSVRIKPVVFEKISQFVSTSPPCSPPTSNRKRFEPTSPKSPPPFPKSLPPSTLPPTPIKTLEPHTVEFEMSVEEFYLPVMRKDKSKK